MAMDNLKSDPQYFLRLFSYRIMCKGVTHPLCSVKSTIFKNLSPCGNGPYYSSLYKSNNGVSNQGVLPPPPQEASHIG